jgi:hypothetical protein
MLDVNPLPPPATTIMSVTYHVREVLESKYVPDAVWPEIFCGVPDFCRQAVGHVRLVHGLPIVDSNVDK